MKDTRFIITVAGGITTSLLLLAIVIATSWFLYGVEIKTSRLGSHNFIVGDPIINLDTHEIIYISETTIGYIIYNKYIVKNPPIGKWSISNWALLHETVRWNKDLRVDKEKHGKPILADSKLRWASRIQKLFGKRIK